MFQMLASPAGAVTSPALPSRSEIRVVVAMTDEATWRDLRILLAGLGVEAVQAAGAAACLAAVEAQDVGLAVVGLQLPDGDGPMLCRVLHERPDGRIPVIIVGEPTTSQEVAYECFEAGALDFLRLPLDPWEVAWRVRTHLCKHSHDARQELLAVGNLFLDLRNHVVGQPGRDVPVTPSECAILRHLMEQPGRAVPIETLLVEALGYPPRLGNPEIVRTHVRNLRMKLEADPHHPVLVVNLPRVGYILRA